MQTQCRLSKSQGHSHRRGEAMKGIPYAFRALFYMAQQVIPAAQLVPRYHTIGRCNNYVVLQSISCSPKCEIVGKILLDHPLSYALTATTDVTVVYLQQFWRIVSKVPDTEDMIKFIDIC
ncbi:hypothetical protein Tco_0691905 [Tanacetum coccineum]